MGRAGLKGLPGNRRRRPRPETPTAADLVNRDFGRTHRTGPAVGHRLLSQAVDRLRPENTLRESQGSTSGSRVTPASTLRHATGSQPDHEPLHPFRPAVQAEVQPTDPWLRVRPTQHRDLQAQTRVSRRPSTPITGPTTPARRTPGRGSSTAVAQPRTPIVCVVAQVKAHTRVFDHNKHPRSPRLSAPSG